MTNALRILLLLLSLALVACPTRGRIDDDDSTSVDDDDSAASDDDDAADDDDVADDDDAADDDDDSTSSSTAPTIDGVVVCETQIVGTPYLRFSITVSDPDGDLLAPVRYSLQYNNVETGGASATETFSVEQDMEFGGTITHLLEIGVDGIDRGVGYEFNWRVLDSLAQASAQWTEGYFINSAAGNDPC